MMEIKDKFWIIDVKDKRLLFDKEKEAITEWQKLAKSSEPKLNELVFTKDSIEYKQVSWEKIALALAKGEIQ